jgi:hypothetical protein
MTNGRDEAAAERYVLVRSGDGTAYAAIPESIVEAHRLSDAQRTELAAQLRADDADVKGFDWRSGGLWPAGTAMPKPLPEYNPKLPMRGGFDSVGLRWVAPQYVSFGSYASAGAYEGRS